MRKIRLYLKVAAVTAVLSAVAFFTFTATRWAFPGGPRLWNTASVVREVQSLSDLVTVKYVMEKVVVIEDANVFGTSRVLLLAHGIIKAGLDLKELKPEDVEISGKTITLRLPAAKITDSYLDEKASQVIDHTTGFLRVFDKSLETAARQNAVEEMVRGARKDGILDEAEKRARTELENLLKRTGFEQVVFR